MMVSFDLMVYNSELSRLCFCDICRVEKSIVFLLSVLKTKFDFFDHDSKLLMFASNNLAFSVIPLTLQWRYNVVSSAN